jgi:hypothetical protein
MMQVLADMHDWMPLERPRALEASTHINGAPSVRLGENLLALEWGGTSIELDSPNGNGKKMAVVLIRALIAAVLREDEIGGLE